jgi:lipoyl-dependent peroxiredoxin
LPPVGRPVSLVRWGLWLNKMLVANKMKVKLPADVAIDAEIDLCNSGDVYFLRARLNVSLPGLEREIAQAIVDATHGETCAYSNATRGNVDVTVKVV